MPQFYFQLLDGLTSDVVEVIDDFASTEDAKKEARRTLAEMARESLTRGMPDMMSVEILDAARKPICEIRAVVEEIQK